MPDAIAYKQKLLKIITKRAIWSVIVRSTNWSGYSRFIIKLYINDKIISYTKILSGARKSWVVSPIRSLPDGIILKLHEHTWY